MAADAPKLPAATEADARLHSDGKGWRLDQAKIVDASTITMTFPDDKSYTGKLTAPRTIRWSNGSAWTKK